VALEWGLSSHSLVRDDDDVDDNIIIIIIIIIIIGYRRET